MDDFPEICEWLGSVHGSPIEGDLQEALKSGVILCEMINAVFPGAVKKIKETKKPFEQMENIEAYVNACRAFGLEEFDLFITADLFDNKNFPGVLKNLEAVSSIAQTEECWQESWPAVGVRLSDRRKEGVLRRRAVNEGSLTKEASMRVPAAAGTKGAMTAAQRHDREMRNSKRDLTDADYQRHRRQSEELKDKIRKKRKQSVFALEAAMDEMNIDLLQDTIGEFEGTVKVLGTAEEKKCLSKAKSKIHEIEAKKAEEARLAKELAQAEKLRLDQERQAAEEERKRKEEELAAKAKAEALESAEIKAALQDLTAERTKLHTEWTELHAAQDALAAEKEAWTNSDERATWVAAKEKKAAQFNVQAKARASRSITLEGELGNVRASSSPSIAEHGDFDAAAMIEGIDSGEVIMEGYMSKLGGKFKSSWQKRWFILTSTTLAWGDHADMQGEDVKSHKNIMIGLVTELKHEDEQITSDDKNTITKKEKHDSKPFLIVGGEKSWKIMASSDEERSQWISAIQKVWAVAHGVA